MRNALAWLLIALPVVCSAQYLSEPADSVANNDPRIARGHDMRALISFASRLPDKSEYESVAAYDGRSAAFKELKVYKGLTLGAQLAFNAGVSSTSQADTPFHVEYDAEAQTVKVCAPSAGIEYVSIEGKLVQGRGYVVWQKVTPLGSYSGTNSFGVRRTVRRQRVQQERVVVPVTPGVGQCTEPTPLTSADARALIPRASIVIIGHVARPFSRVDVSTSGATLSEPTEEHLERIDLALVYDEVALVAGDKVLLRKPISP